MLDRLGVIKRDLATQIKMDFEKAFSIRGTPVCAPALTWEPDLLLML